MSVLSKVILEKRDEYSDLFSKIKIDADIFFMDYFPKIKYNIMESRSEFISEDIDITSMSIIRSSALFLESYLHYKLDTIKDYLLYENFMFGPSSSPIAPIGGSYPVQIDSHLKTVNITPDKLPSSILYNFFTSALKMPDRTPGRPVVNAIKHYYSTPDNPRSERYSSFRTHGIFESVFNLSKPESSGMTIYVSKCVHNDFSPYIPQKTILIKHLLEENLRKELGHKFFFDPVIMLLYRVYNKFYPDCELYKNFIDYNVLLLEYLEYLNENNLNYYADKLENYRKTFNDEFNSLYKTLFSNSILKQMLVDRDSLHINHYFKFDNMVEQVMRDYAERIVEVTDSLFLDFIKFFVELHLDVLKSFKENLRKHASFEEYYDNFKSVLHNELNDIFLDIFDIMNDSYLETLKTIEYNNFMDYLNSVYRRKT